MSVHIKKTRITPEFRIDNNLIEFNGRSIPEDAYEFFEPVLNHINNYFLGNPQPTQINIQLEYVNSGSKKYLTNILKILESKALRGQEVAIHWFYDKEDESIFELGADLKSLLELPFFLEEMEQLS